MIKFNYKEPKDIFSLFGVLFILIALPLTIVAVLTSQSFRKNAAGTATLYLSPATKTVNQNTTFTVQIRENSGTDPVNAVQADITYDATKLDFVSFDGTGSAFGIDASSTPAGTSTGSISTARGVSGGLPPVTGDQLVSTITFKARTGSAVTAVNIAATSVIARSTDNTNILGTPTGGSFTIVDPPPTVTITSPAANAIISGAITVNATATDDLAVTKVELYVDNVLTGSPDTTVPYSFTVTPANGAHTIMVKAYDATSNTPASVNITEDSQAPTTSITSPAAASLLRGSVTVSANATDNVGISKVEFYVDGVLKGSPDTTSPYNFTWDTTTATNASHSLTVKAYDTATPVNVATSAAVSVTVDNSAPTAALLTCTAPSQTEIDLSWTASTDNIGVVGYDLYKNSVKLTSLANTVTTYKDTAVVGSTVYTYFLVSKDGAGNTTNSATINCSTRKPGDVDGNGTIDITDLSILLSNWGKNYPAADFNGSGTVDITDLSILLSNWGK